MLGQHSLNASQTDPSMAPKNVGDDAEVSNRVLFALSGVPQSLAVSAVGPMDSAMSRAGWVQRVSAVGISDTT